MKFIDTGHISTAARGVFTALSLFSLMLAGVYFEAQENELSSVLTAAAIVAETPLVPPPIEAKAAVIYDAKTGKVLFAKNAEQALPLASLTKLMAAKAILTLQDGDADITITREALASEGDSGLRIGDVWSLSDLLTFGLVASSNDAMSAAAGSVGVDRIVTEMNSEAKESGLTTMQFSNPTGLDLDATVAGAYGSAHDVAVFASEFLNKYPALFSNTVSLSTRITGGGHDMEANPTSEPILDIPGLIGAKTGYTDLAGGNLVAAFDIELGHPVIAVVLGSTREGRFTDVRTLITATRDSFTK